MQHPRLEWSTPGGYSRTGSSEVLSGSIELFDILSIVEDVDDEEGLDTVAEADEDLCFFSITNMEGEVFMFETVTWEEKDRIVCGIKNIVSRLSYNLVAGESSVVDEFFHEETPDNESGELPSLRTPVQHMHAVTQRFIDCAPIRKDQD